MNVWGDECLILARGWWMSEVMNVWGDECLRWWMSEVMNVRGDECLILQLWVMNVWGDECRGDECLILGRGWWKSKVMNVWIQSGGDECLRWWMSDNPNSTEEPKNAFKCVWTFFYNFFISTHPQTLIFLAENLIQRDGQMDKLTNSQVWSSPLDV